MGLCVRFSNSVGILFRSALEIEVHDVCSVIGLSKVQFGRIRSLWRIFHGIDHSKIARAIVQQTLVILYNGYAYDTTNHILYNGYAYDTTNHILYNG